MRFLTIKQVFDMADHELFLRMTQCPHCGQPIHKKREERKEDANSTG